MEILDEVPKNRGLILEKLNKRRKIFMYFASGICVVTGILMSMARNVSDPFAIIGGIISTFILCFFLGAILGALIALFPNQGLTYLQKYSVSAMTGALIMSVLFLIVHASRF